MPLLTPKGKFSTKHPLYNMTWRRAMRMEKIARLTLDPAGYSNTDIAAHLQCHVQSIIEIKKTPQFHAKMLELSSGIVSEYDADVRANGEAAREELQSLIPNAMNVIKNALRSKNERIALSAAQEVFDREGSLAKVSKSAVEHKIAPPMEVDPAIASNLLALFGGAPGASSEMQETLSGFSATAAQAEAQLKDLDGQTTAEFLASLDELKTQKPN